jgi:hypothetical protein
MRHRVAWQALVVGIGVALLPVAGRAQSAAAPATLDTLLELQRTGP